ncbi:MAG: hypothetical protein Ct9H300mP28_32610 [Pseudomonadota bacterium]|nr:MAG: hypothetical protein Ct9H300mP28_32610 [Pseudomonadota bacterium]
MPENAQGYITRVYKSELQEHVQKLTGMPSKYELVDEKGPDHQKDSPWRSLSEIRNMAGKWSNKKLANQLAAENALGRIQRDPSLLEGGKPADEKY